MTQGNIDIAYPAVLVWFPTSHMMCSQKFLSSQAGEALKYQLSVVFLADLDVPVGA